METQTVHVPQLAYYGDSEFELVLPARWDVERRAMPWASRAPLGDGEIRSALAIPTASPSLRELAQDRDQAVIIFDDIARPTPVHRVWPFVVEELHAGGMRDDQIRMVVALGTHAAHTRDQMQRKLGEEALRRFRVYNHNCYEHCTLVGTTDQGTPVEVNDEVLACDLRIGIGSVLPHPSMGFGGGPKIILPGVVSMRTIRTHHTDLGRRLSEEGHGATMRAGVAEGPLWQDIAQAAEIAGLDFVVDTILNERRQVVGLVAGHPVEAWRRGVDLAKKAYATPAPDGAEIVITTGYGKGNEAMISAYAAGLERGAPPEGRTVVALSIAPHGVVVHYLMGDFGDATWANRPRRRRQRHPSIKRMIICNPYPEATTQAFFGSEPAPIEVDSWEDALELLQEWYPGDARVIVYPDLTMQYLV